jgi:glutamate synthase (NADPH/NADH) small chain
MAEHYKPTKYRAWEMTLEERFQEIYPPFSRREAELEANRCLYCYDAPCMVACPTHIDIPTFIKKIGSGNVKGAAGTILEANLLGATCSRVCPVDVLCEGACVLKAEHKPIVIGRLQRYATDFAKEKGARFFKPHAPNGKKVAVVGAGPAGLSCAGELAKEGFAVTIFEKRDLAGGLSTYGIVVFREPVQVSLDEVKMIQELGVEIKTGVEIGVDISFDKLIADFDAVFVSVGLGRVPQLVVPGEELAGVVDGLDFIEATKVEKLEKIKIGERVCIIGAGNTAIDCATIARRLGAQRVTLIYRRSEAEMPAYYFEYEFALKEGVSFMFLTQPVEVIGQDGQIQGLKCVRMDLGAADQSGRRTSQPVADSDFVVPCDMVIKAIGQVKPQSLWDSLSSFGVKTVKGYLDVDADTRQTAHEKIFAGGDCVRSVGEASTVMAVQDGKLAARAIGRQLLSEVEMIASIKQNK